MGQAAFPDLLGGEIGDILSVQVYLTFLHLTQAGDGLDKFALAVAVDTGDADDLPGTHFQINAPDLGDLLFSRCPQVLHLQHHIAYLGSFPLDIQENLPADHHLGQLLR